MPKVCVVIPTYNRASDLKRCLDSLVLQTFRDFEVRVCDDGSTDGSREVALSFKAVLDLHYHWAENFGGPARPRNVGWQMSDAPYVAFLDSDDWWAPEKLEKSVHALEKGADLVYHALWVISDPNISAKSALLPVRTLSAPVFDKLLRYGNCIPNSSVVVKKVFLEVVGGFCEDPAFIAGEDFDCWLRIARLTDRFTCLAEAPGFYWDGGGNISSHRRMLCVLESFQERYFPSQKLLPFWFLYRQAVALHHTGRYREAAIGLLGCWQRADSLPDFWNLTKFSLKNLFVWAMHRLSIPDGK